MYEAKRLLPRHFKIVDLYLAGLNIKQISQELGMSSAGVSNIVNSPKVQDEVARRREGQNKDLSQMNVSTIENAKHLLNEKAIQAAQVHVDILEDETASHSQKQSSANAILDRCFNDGKDNNQVATVLTADTINVLNVSIKEAFDGD